MINDVLLYFIDQLELGDEFLTTHKDQLLSLMLELVRPEHGNETRQLMLNGRPIRQVFLKVNGFAYAFRNSRHNKGYIAPYLWTGMSLMADWQAVLKNKNARFNVEVASNVKIFSFGIQDLKLMKRRFPALKNAYQKMSKRQNSYLKIYEDNLHALTAKERYANLLEDRHHELHLIPQIHQAEHLGVTPEYFSAMKKNIRLNSGGPFKGSPFSFLMGLSL